MSISFVTDSKYTKIQIAVSTGNAKVLYSQLLNHSLTKESVLSPPECHKVNSTATLQEHLAHCVILGEKSNL
jgi:hypothetical protein